ncbi:MAG: Double zinc ribbon [Blastocatellia bacterium]
MFCPSCGTEVPPSLSYCNRCGAALNAKARSESKLSATYPESLIWATVAVTVGGLAILIGLMAVMKEAHFDEGLIAGFTGLAFLLLLAAESVFIWLLLRSRRGAKETSHVIQPQKSTMRELDAAPARGLPEPSSSVAEHTTRTLEPTHSERNAE